MAASVLAALAVGSCSPQPRAKVSGRLIVGMAGYGVCNFSIPDGQRTLIWRGPVAPALQIGIGGLRSDGLLVSSEDSVLKVSVTNGRAETLWRGMFPTVARDGKWVVFYSWQDPTAGVMTVVRARLDSLAPLDTLGHMARMCGPDRLEWTLFWAPVQMDANWVAVTGPDSAVWKVDVESGRWVSLGIKNAEPMFWHEKQGLLVCRGVWDGGRVVAYDAQGRRVGRVPSLDKMIGYATWEGTDTTLVVVSGPPRLRDSFDLRIFDWRRGRMGPVVASDFDFPGRGLWLADRVH